MTNAPVTTPKSDPGSEPSRRRFVLARVLTVVAIVLAVVSVLATFVAWEALDESQFRNTSHALIANPTVRNQVAAVLVEELYANVDTSASLRDRLPPDLKALAGPIAGGIRDIVDRSARSLLERPRVQDTFVNAASGAQRALVAVLDGDTERLQTSDGNVVLDLRPLVLELGERFSVPDLEAKLPDGAARVTILRSNQLKIAQDGTRLLRFVANWIWVLGLVAAAAAVWLARGRRRLEVRALAIGVLVAGVLILIVQSLVGRYLIDHLVATASVRPPAAAVYSVLTDLLRGDGWTAIIIGLITLLGIWLSGPGARAVATRRALSPYLRRPEVAYPTLVVAYVLLLWWRPTPQFGFPRSVVVWFVLALVGLEALRRQAAREFPDTEAVDLLVATRDRVKRGRRAAALGGTAEELERLARLHAEGAIDEQEFAAAKAQLLDVRPLAGVS